MGGLTGLADKTVGVIGTGATAVQCVPHLAAGARRLFVFQRTPSSIDLRANRPTDPQWAASLGVRVITTVSTPAKAELSRQAGATDVLDYPGDDPHEFGRRIRDLTGTRAPALLAGALRSAVQQPVFD